MERIVENSVLYFVSIRNVSLDDCQRVVKREAVSLP